LTGDRSPLTEKDFKKVDLDRLKGAVERQIAEGKTSGEIGYGDFGTKPGEFTSFGNNENLAEMIINSFTDPNYRLETTIGMATWRRDEDGSIVIEDRYNFNASREVVDKRLAKKGQVALFVDAFAKAGWSGVINALGNIYGDTESEPGNVVKINLGKL